MAQSSLDLFASAAQGILSSVSLKSSTFLKAAHLPFPILVLSTLYHAGPLGPSYL